MIKISQLFFVFYLSLFLTTPAFSEENKPLPPTSTKDLLHYIKAQNNEPPDAEITTKKPSQNNAIYSFYTDNELNGFFMTSNTIAEDPKKFFVFGFIQGFFMANPKLYLSLYPKTNMMTIYRKVHKYYIDYPEDQYKTITDVILAKCENPKKENTVSEQNKPLSDPQQKPKLEPDQTKADTTPPQTTAQPQL